MKKIFIVLVFSFCTSFVYSQDLIVTGEGDSINCRITRMKSGHVYFTFKHNEEFRNTLLPLTDVKDYKYGFFEEAVVPKDKIKAPINYQRFRFALNGGFSYETAKISKSVQSDFRDYVKELKSGDHLGGDVNYFFSEQLGFGAKFIRFHTTNQMDGIYLTDNGGTTMYGKMSDDIKVTFFGPSFAYRFLNQSGKNAFILNYALGYMGYRNDFVLIEPYYMKGGTVGTALDIGYDMGISKNLSLGLQLSLIGGTMSQYKLYKGSLIEKVELEQGEYESLSRIDLSIGIRYSL